LILRSPKTTQKSPTYSEQPGHLNLLEPVSALLLEEVLLREKHTLSLLDEFYFYRFSYLGETMRNLSRNRIPSWPALLISILIALVFYRYRWGILGIVGIGPFPHACESVEALEDYLSGGGDPSAYLGYTPLIMCATEAGSEEVVAKLIEIGVNVDAQKGAFPLDMDASEGTTALYVAVREDNQEMAKLLVEAGADINLFTRRLSNSPLNLAIIYNRAEILDFFLDSNLEAYEFDEGIIDDAGMGDLEVLKVLIAHDLEFDDAYRYALDKAIRFGYLDEVKFLVERGFEAPNAVHGAAANGHLDVLNFLIKNGYDLNAVDDEGNTPLHIVGHPRLEVAQFLIQNGADINAENLEGQTPLDIAIAQNHSELADLLKAAGAKPSE